MIWKIKAFEIFGYLVWVRIPDHAHIAIADHVVCVNWIFNCHQGSKGPKISPRLPRVLHKYIQTVILESKIVDKSKIVEQLDDQGFNKIKIVEKSTIYKIGATIFFYQIGVQLYCIHWICTN